MKKLKQIVTAIVVSVALCLSPIVPTFAAEEVRYSNIADLKYMNDGTLFDPLYYANENPDVVKAIYNSTLKVTEAQLYQHYKAAGKQEGRLPYNIKEADKVFPISPKKDVDAFGGIPYNSNFINKFYFKVGGDGEFLTFTDDAGEFGKFPEGVIYCPQTLKSYYFDHACVTYPNLLRVYYSRDGEQRIIFWGANSLDLENITDQFEMGQMYKS